MLAHERLTEPRVTMDKLLAYPMSFSNLPAFLDTQTDELCTILNVFFLESETNLYQYGPGPGRTFYIKLLLQTTRIQVQKKQRLEN